MPNSGLFPIARPIADTLPNGEAPEIPLVSPSGVSDFPNFPIPQPPIHFCGLSFPQGCYQLSITSTASSPHVLFRSFKLGSLRVESSASGYVISGDTYRYSMFDLLRGGMPSF